jgi:hypothetical protein
MRLLIATLMIMMIASVADAAPCPGGKCPVPSVFSVPVVVEVASPANVGERAVRRPMRGLFAKLNDTIRSRPKRARKALKAVLKLPRLGRCR